MREFIYYSKNGRTSGNIGTDLMKAGRMDIALQFVIMSFYISNEMRDNVKLHLHFNGSPDPPKHLELNPSEDIDNELAISKKNVLGLIKKMLYKYKPGKKNQVFPGYYVEKKEFSDLLDELEESHKTIYLLDKNGEDIREIEICDNPVFIFGDHDGIPKNELKNMRKMKIKKVSVGNCVYFASQTLTIVQNELDRRGI
ncbi:hypothetical protein GOV12_03190 [Candidatus Pacearchaeota archaeon]|nr:hypothetical protein [Candidatus Pacearchaeota archaeon]